MPLAFQSIDRGSVPFGYFNIDTDLLLLRHHFFFTDTFTAAVGAVALATGEPRLEVEVEVEGWVVAPAERVGNVMGAIHGFDRSGFIGAVYDRFPFPERPEEFRQRAAGVANRDEIVGLLSEWAEPTTFRLTVDSTLGQVSLAGTAFDFPWFRELVAYVWRGGYPRWLDDVRPDEVLRMQEAVEGSNHPLFVGQGWDLEAPP